MWIPRLVFLATAVLALVSCGGSQIDGTDATLSQNGGVPGFEIVAMHPHDPDSFTQGLEFFGDQLIESTGLRGESTIRLVDPETGMVSSSLEVDDQFFAEGATVVGDRIFQLTWTSEIGFIYTIEDGQIQPSTEQFEYSGQGWGICELENGELLRSDGTSTLTFHDPATFDVLRTVDVTLGSESLERINELECDGNTALANIWLEIELVRIDLETGEVISVLDLSSLVPESVEGDREAVLNGIALNPDTGNLWVTGKRWPALFELDISNF